MLCRCREVAVDSAVAKYGKGAVQGAVHSAVQAAVGVLRLLLTVRQRGPFPEPAVARTGNPWLQDWEAMVPTFGDH